MARSARRPSSWTEPRTLHADGWEIAACPVNGPAVAANGDRLAVAWFTAPAGGPDLEVTPRVLVAFSEDTGATFGAPIRVDGGHPAGRIDVEWLPDGRAAISWIERTPGGGAEVRVRPVNLDGTPGDPTAVASTSAERTSGFPRMARRGPDLVIAWTEPGDPDRVLLARLAVSETDEPTPEAELDGPDVEGPPAEDLIGADLNGNRIRLSDLRGKVVLVDFWGIWCPPCRREIPDLIRLYEELHDRGLEIVAVNSGDDPEIVPAFVEEHRIPYPVILDEGMAARYGVVAYPTHVILDRAGRVRHREVGGDASGIGRLEVVLSELLAEPSN